MKKLIALALAVTLLASMAVTVSAANTTTLTATVPAAGYTLNIPANQEVNFGTTQADIGNITVTDSAGFAVGKNLQVTVTYDAFSADKISTQIPYTASHCTRRAARQTQEPQHIILQQKIFLPAVHLYFRVKLPVRLPRIFYLKQLIVTTAQQK